MSKATHVYAGVVYEGEHKGRLVVAEFTMKGVPGTFLRDYADQKVVDYRDSYEAAYALRDAHAKEHNLIPTV